MRFPRPVTVLRGLLALAMVVALTFGVPVLLVAMIGNPVPHQWSWNQPLTNDAILGVVACVAWLFWTQFIICLVVEIIAEVRLAAGRSADWLARVPGTFGGQQAFARLLVQAVVAAALTSSAAAVAPTPWTWHADAATVAEPAQTGSAAAPLVKPPALRDVKTRRVSTAALEVRKGDTLWSIAEAHLGAGERWREIAGLNHGRLMSDGQRFVDADRIRPGWVLLIPQGAVENSAVMLTVRPGDTLWKIARHEYGDGDDWSTIFDANRAQIDDPDLIYPGQKFTIPKQVPTRPSAQSKASAGSNRTRPVEVPPSRPRAPTPVSEPPSHPAQTPEHSSVVSEGDEDSQVLSTLARALAGGGLLLAGCLAAAYTARRRAQFRVRRSGRTIPRTPPQLVPVESDIRSAGLAGGEAVGFLDRALRDLASRASRLPEVVAARLTDDSLELVFHQALKTAPQGWQVADAGTRWRLPRTHRLGVPTGLAPYPTLVTLGVDPDGGTWLVDLEAAGLVQLCGPSRVCDDVIRFLAAELATNRWSDVVKVLATGIGSDLVHLNPGCLELVEEVDLDRLVKKALRVAEIRRLTDLDVLTGRQNTDSGDTWNPLLILAANSSSATGGPTAGELMKVRDGHRAATALVSARDTGPDGLTIVVDEAGYATIPWGGPIQVNRLSAEDARAIGAAFANVKQLDDQPIPVGPLAGAGPVAGLADEAGRLVSELTTPRPAEEPTRSLLPELNAAYLDTAATTEEDLQILAPGIPPTVEETVRAADPHLDADVAEWFAGAVIRPQLRLLGPIELRVQRPVPDVARGRVAYLTEVTAYLFCHSGGVTSSRLAYVFGVQANTVHKRIQELRDWLGEDPTTGTQRLPEAKLSEPGATRGVGNYVLTDMLCDIDLFRRLRVRGQARGADGIEDLVAALRLVSGPPFDQQRANGYGWLASDSTDHHLTAGIVDVAHILATEALAAGDAERAAWAATQAIGIAPFEDKPRLDYAAALEAMGHATEAKAYLDREVFNRSDDDLAPPDPTIRVCQVAARQDPRSGQISLPTSRTSLGNS